MTLAAAAMMADSSSFLFPNATLIVEIIVFLAVLYVLYRAAYKPLIRAIDQRQQRIGQALRDAAEAEHRLASVREQVERLLEEARSQAREITSRAQREAAADSDEIRARARQDATAFVDQARGEIDAERDRALRELRGQFGALVVAAAARVLGESIDQKAHQSLIEKSLQSLETMR